MVVKVEMSLEMSDGGDVGYLYLPAHPGPGVPGASARQMLLRSVVADYHGPEIVLDFNGDGVIIGMEIVLD